MKRPNAPASKGKSSKSVSKWRSGGSLGQLHRDSLEFRKELQKNNSLTYRPGIDISVLMNASDWEDTAAKSSKSSRKH